MRRWLFVLMLLSTSAFFPTRGQCASESISLDGTWKICADASNVGKTEAWFDGSLTSRETFDVSVPGVLQEVFKEYHGVVWYEREFVTPENPNDAGRAFLRFWQAEYRADVWLNGVYLGWHEGGEEEFELDATDALNTVGASNRLTVRVLNAADEPIDGISTANVPRRNNTNVATPGCGYASGGLVDSVELLLTPVVRIVDLQLLPNWLSGEIGVRATFENKTSASVSGVLTLFASSVDGGEFTRPVSFDATVEPGVSCVDGKLTVPNFKLWNLNDPNLYSVVADFSSNDGALDDRRASTCGFRDFRFERGYFRLNGKRIYVKCSHSGSDSPITHRVPFDPDLYRKDIISCKTMGFNMIRYIAGMPRRFQLDLCDRIGFLVYDECLAGWQYGPCPERIERYDAQTSGMIRRDRNHPSVVIWGLLNETTDLQLVLHAASFLKTVRELDPDRIVLLNSGSFDAFANDSARVANYAIWRRENGPIMPAAIKNETDESFFFDGTQWTARTFFLHPGDVMNEYVALKWTAPKDGNYKIDAKFWDVVVHGVATVDIRAFKETQDAEPQELWTSYLNLNGVEKETRFTKDSLFFRKGDSFDVVIGIGDDRGTGDTTAVDLKITDDAGKIYDVNSDFSFERNPNGVWSFGYLPAGSAPDLNAFKALEIGQKTLSFEPIGRFANPGSSQWQNELADAHPYKPVPHTAAVIQELRTHAKNGQPVFLSEYGIGSGVDLFRLTRYFEQYGATDAADALHYRWRYDQFMNDWNRWKLEETFATPEVFFRQAIARMAEQRRIGINAIRANANVVAHSVTGTHDQGISGEGLTTIFRELKPGTVDAMADVFAPLRFCNFVEPVQVYAGQKVKIESVLVNEDVLKPGDYPVRYVVVDANNKRLFDETRVLTIPEPKEGEEFPIVTPAFSAEFVVDSKARGECKFYAEFQKNGAASGGVERFFAFDKADMPDVGEGAIYVWGDDPDLLAKLDAMGIKAGPFTTSDGQAVEPQSGDRILVGKTTNRKNAEEFAKLYDLVRSGVNVVFLSCDVFAEENDPTRYLPFEGKGVIERQYGWLYHKDDWAKRDAAFAGLQSGEVVDYLFYRELIPSVTFKDQKPEPDEALAGAFDTQTGYKSGLTMARWRLGKGEIVVSTWTVQEAAPSPIAERMLRNLLIQAARQ